MKIKIKSITLTDLFLFDEGDLEVLAELVGAAKADDATALKCCDSCKPCAC